MRSLCLLRVASLLAVASLPAQEATHEIRETFGAAEAGDFARRWETAGGNWLVRDGALHGESASRRAFAYLADLPESAHLEVTGRLRVSGRDVQQGWCVAGMTVYLGATDFWQLALVEGPDGKRYVELVEMLAGTWQAQRAEGTALRPVDNDGQWAGWEHGRDYLLTLALSPQMVSGKVTDAESGALLTHLSYAWDGVPGVRSGRPGFLTGGLRLEATGLAARWAAPAAAGSGVAVETGEHGAWALLADAGAGIDEADAGSVANALRQGGFGVTAVTCADLASPGFLDPSRFSGLVLANSRRFPAAAEAGLQRFLRGGGDLVLMGGMPFSEPLHRVGDAWLTQDEAESRLTDTALTQRLFDFETGTAEGWKRASNHLERPSQAGIVAGPTGKALQLDIRGIEGWDTFNRDLPEPWAAGNNVLLFRACAGPATTAMLVEIRERDGSRWIATVPLGTAWRAYALPASRFAYWGDASPEGRGTPGDFLHVERAQTLSFGLGESHLRGVRGDHRILVDEVGTGRAELPDAPLGPGLGLNAFSPYAVYRMSGVRRVSAAPSARAAVDAGLGMEVDCDGWSAVGFAFPNESVFEPLLVAEDAAGRSLGWAAGALLNHRGTYRNSAWLLLGLESPAFYRSRAFLEALPGLLRQVTRPDTFHELRGKEAAARLTAYPLQTAAPHAGFIRRSDDGRHLVYPDGRRFFMIGCNYVGGFTRCGGRMWTDEFFDAREVEDDFRKASQAGLNIMRYWVQGTLDEDIRRGDLRKVHTIRECARRHGVYLLLDLPGTGYPTEQAMVESHRRIAEAFRDEPMVLGYDLRNEPYVTTLGGIHYTTAPPPVQTADLAAVYPELVEMDKVEGWLAERPWWLHLPVWIQGEEARKVAVANALWSRYTGEFNLRSSSLPGLDGAVPVGRWQPLITVVNQSLERWIDTQVRAIRAVDPQHLITDGHNTALGILPANASLDFVSSHIYVRPFSRGHVVENITTLDRLKSLWGDRPVTLGEFGYSNGIPMGDSYLDPHSSSVGEMIHFLYAFANDFDGCKKWMLVDWPLAVMQHYGDWNRGLSTRIYEERFGLYSYDGTREGRAKPIVAALRFFRGIVDETPPGGTLSITDDDNPIGTGYVFRTANALCVGGRRADLPELRFDCSETVNVMLAWDEGELRMLATADVTVELDLPALVGAPADRSPAVRGTARPPAQRNGRWAVDLLAGTTATLARNAGR